MSIAVGKFSKSENINCYICNLHIKNAPKNAFRIFNGTENTLVVAHLEAILNVNIISTNVHSQFICGKCKKLCTEYEELTERLQQIRNEIIITYNNGFSNDSVILQIKEETVNDAESNDDFDDVLEDTTANSEDNMDESVDELTELSTEVTNVVEPTEKSSQQIMIKENEVLVLNVKTSTSQNEETLSTPPPAPSAILSNSDSLIEQSAQLITLHTDDTKFFEETDANMVEICTENNFDDFLDEQTIETIVDENGLAYNADGDIIAIGNEIETINFIHHSSSDGDDNDDPSSPQPAVKLAQANKSSPKAIEMKPIFLKSGTNFICQLCPIDVENVFDVSSIGAHLKGQHEERVHICDVCGADFRKRNELNEHFQQHSNKQDGDFQCDSCSRTFTSLRLFRVHKRMHATKIKSWKCEECNKKYSSKNLLDEHMNMHTGDRPYKCQHCSKDFASKYTLTAHLKIHTNRQRPFKCNTCSKSFFSIQNLTQHERTHTGVKEFVCNVCSKAFGTLHNLDVHKIVHTGYKPFICRTCGKAFARRAEIKDHERTHTGEKPYNCDICGASFAQRSNLMSHKRATHLNDKRYKCDLCEKSFKRRRLLDYHKKATHTGERPYKCESCLSTFVYPEHYKKHLRIHTGAKPYKCEVCGKAFNSRDNRNAHRFVHSDKKPYECVFCGQGFMRKPLLLAHMEQQNHKNEVIITNHAHISLAIGSGDEYLDTDENMKNKSPGQFLNDNNIIVGDDDDCDDDDVDEPLDEEIIEEQHIIEEIEEEGNEEIELIIQNCTSPYSVYSDPLI